MHDLQRSELCLNEQHLFEPRAQHSEGLQRWPSEHAHICHCCRISCMRLPTSLGCNLCNLCNLYCEIIKLPHKLHTYESWLPDATFSIFLAVIWALVARGSCNACQICSPCSDCFFLTLDI